MQALAAIFLVLLLIGTAVAIVLLVRERLARSRFRALCERRQWTYRSTARLADLDVLRFRPPAGDPGPVIRGEVDGHPFRIVHFTFRSSGDTMRDSHNREIEIVNNIAATLHVVDLPTDPEVLARLALPSGWERNDDSATLVVHGPFDTTDLAARIDHVGAAIAAAVTPPWPTYAPERPDDAGPARDEPSDMQGGAPWKLYPEAEPSAVPTEVQTRPEDVSRA